MRKLKALLKKHLAFIPSLQPHVMTSSSQVTTTVIFTRVLKSCSLLLVASFLVAPSHSFFHEIYRPAQPQQRYSPFSIIPSMSSYRSNSRAAVCCIGDCRTSVLKAAKDNKEEKEADEEEWEYEEYEELQESDFYNSEWKVGTVWETNRQKIDVTWCRLIAKEKELKAIWGDGAMGKWSFDRGSQFFSVSKETWGGWGGKKIWAGVIDDYYFMEGTVRGWSPLSPASVLGQWQAKRLGVDPEEMGVAPWFQEDSDDEDQISIEPNEDRGSDTFASEALLKDNTDEKEVQSQDILNNTTRTESAPFFASSE